MIHSKRIIWILLGDPLEVLHGPVIIEVVKPIESFRIEGIVRAESL